MVSRGPDGNLNTRDREKIWVGLPGEKRDHSGCFLEGEERADYIEGRAGSQNHKKRARDEMDSLGLSARFFERSERNGV